jgi:hypothetical protein
MELLLGEHGETLLYGIIGIMMVLLITNICAEKWQKITPEYKAGISKDSGTFLSGYTQQFPTIEADEVLFAEYKNTEFNYRDFITAKDCNGKDITENVKIYGDVDVFQKGLYKLRCVVVAENSLACTKYVNVIVE